MKKCIKMGFFLIMLIAIIRIDNLTVLAEENDINYERDYLKKIYNSENGLEGTVANCVYSSSEGFLWVGSYTGLYRYDGTEFKRYLMNGRALPIKDIVEDENGVLWVGTNGDGLYRFDGKEFSEVKLNTNQDGAYIITKLYIDSCKKIWVGTKAGVFWSSTDDSERMKEHSRFSNLEIADIKELVTGEIVVIDKSGKVYVLNEDNLKEIKLDCLNKEERVRCSSSGELDYFYVGTTQNHIIKISNEGKIIKIIENDNIYSINSIYKIRDDEYWVCSDSGIAILKNDNITKLQLRINESVEDVCSDFQGNFWFASSREGVLQLYENYFSDLYSYWDLHEIVNSIQIYQEKTYVGCDTGLFCYINDISVKDELVEACNGVRIRQIYQDREQNLWVSTYMDGIKILHSDGKISSLNMSNSELTTNEIRCVWQSESGKIYIGTEEGVFVKKQTGEITQLVDDPVLNSKRILDVKEAKNGKIYVATDGHGLYVINNNFVEKIYSKKQGLPSGVILKVVPSEQMNGIWIVTGEGIYFIDEKGYVEAVTEIPIVNSLDLMLTENGDAVVLAGNGYFRLKEEDLLKKEKISYVHFNREDGLPIDFTANSWNFIKDDILYMCGTTGATSIDLNAKQIERPIRLYLNKVREDGEKIETFEDKVIISSGASRINVDVRLINFVHRNIYTNYFLEGVDPAPMLRNGNETTGVSYTNLKGGRYTYQYKVYDSDSEKCIAEITIPIVKNYAMLEQPEVKVLCTLFTLAFFVFLFIILIWLRDKQIKIKYLREFKKEKEEEISKLAYKDLVTGMYNRNYFEQERENVNVKEIYALFSISVNHIEYLKSKYGVSHTDDILKKAAQILRESMSDDVKIYRVTEKGFFFWTTKPIQIETYIYEVKEKFQKYGEEERIALSFAAGAIYNNPVEKATFDELIRRCGDIRLLDEKNMESKFIEGKMKLL